MHCKLNFPCLPLDARVGTHVAGNLERVALIAESRTDGDGTDSGRANKFAERKFSVQGQRATKFWNIGRRSALRFKRGNKVARS